MVSKIEEIAANYIVNPSMCARIAQKFVKSTMYLSLQEVTLALTLPRPQVVSFHNLLRSCEYAFYAVNGELYKLNQNYS